MSKKTSRDIPLEIPCIILPITDDKLLIPSVAVAEMVNEGRYTEINSNTPWLFGSYNWRGLDLPLVSYESFRTNNREPVAKNPRIAVMNGISGDKALPFYAMLVNGLPRLVRITNNIIQKEKFEGVTFGEACRFYIGGKEMVVPNLDLLEQRVLKRAS